VETTVGVDRCDDFTECNGRAGVGGCCCGGGEERGDGPIMSDEGREWPGWG